MRKEYVGLLNKVLLSQNEVKYIDRKDKDYTMKHSEVCCIVLPFNLKGDYSATINSTSSI